MEELMVRHGVCDLPLTEVNKEQAVHSVIMGEVLLSRTKALDAIIAGMNVINLGSFVRTRPSLRSILFPTPSEIDIDIGFLKKKMVLDSQLDTDKKKNAYHWFMTFVEECKKPLG